MDPSGGRFNGTVFSRQRAVAERWIERAEGRIGGEGLAASAARGGPSAPASRRLRRWPARPNGYSLSKNGSGWTLALPPVVKVKVSPKEQFVLLLGIRGRVSAADGVPPAVFQKSVQLPWLNNRYV